METEKLYLTEEKEELFAIKENTHIIFESKNNVQLNAALSQIKNKYEILRKFEATNEFTFLISLAGKPSEKHIEQLNEILDDDLFKNIKIIVFFCEKNKFLGYDINKNITDQVLKEIINDINVMKTDINVMKTDINLMKTDINQIETRMNKIETRMNKIETGMDEIKTEMVEIKTGMVEIKSGMVEIKNNMNILMNIFNEKFAGKSSSIEEK